MKAGVGRVARRLVWPVVITAVVAVLLSIAVVPTRTYLDKRQAVASTEARLDQLAKANAAAQVHVDALGTDAEIERLAREKYGLVRQGEETYRVVPVPEPPVQVPDVWPFNRLRTRIGG